MTDLTEILQNSERLVVDAQKLLDDLKALSQQSEPEPEPTVKEGIWINAL
jgi:hypothetical protein